MSDLAHSSAPNWTDEVARIVEFLDVSSVAFADAEQIITGKIADLVQGPVTCKFFCPGNKGDAGNYLVVSSNTTKTKVESVQNSDLESADGRRKVLTVYIEEFDEGGYINPHIHIYFNEAVPASSLHIIEQVISDLVSRVVRRQHALLRRCLINSRIDSDDLGTFLHKTLVANMAHRHIGVEAASIFVLDPTGKLIRLRGTTGMRSGKNRTDVFFHNDSSVKVWDVQRTESPLVEYDHVNGLSEGESAEKIPEKPYYRLYWPIRLRDRFRGTDNRFKTPTIGVMRFVNSANPDRYREPFTWLRHSVVNYFSEMLYIIIEGYILVDAASFKRDEAFHGSTSVIDTVCKNVNLVRRVLFDDIHPVLDESPIRRQFQIVPIRDAARMDAGRLRKLLDTAYASATDLSFQIERANQHTPHNGRRVTERLMSDVILRAWEQLEDMALAHSVREHFMRPTIKVLFERANYPPAVYGAPEALVSVFANVLENAVKYRRPRKPIYIDLRFETDDEHVIVCLRDKGIGISEGDEERIFTSGYRTQEAREFVKRGSGLGLAWCRDVLAPIGGRIHAERREPGLEVQISLKRTQT